MKKIVWALLISLVTFTVSAQKKADLTIIITGLNNTDGQVLIALFDTPENFPDAGESACGSQKLNLEGDTLRASFLDLPAGTYAVSFVHDENKNNKMDRNMGIPREKYGVSNNIRMGFGPPKFNEAKFQLKGDTTIFIKPSN
jgi:uncharacterized protein (DUF2141 family)